MVNLKQLGIAFIGLAIGGGFAFGGIASYAGMIGGSNQNQQQQFNTTMPSSSFMESAFNLGPREQRVLAYRNDIVFVNGFYDTEEQKEKMVEEYSNLSSDFNGRVYVSVANSTSESDILYNYGLTSFPKTVVVGGNQQYSGQPVDSVDNEKITEEICNAFRELGSSAAKCL